MLSTVLFIITSFAIFFIIFSSIITAVFLSLFPFLVGSEDSSTTFIGYFYFLIFIVSSTILFFNLRFALIKNK